METNLQSSQLRPYSSRDDTIVDSMSESGASSTFTATSSRTKSE